MVEDRGLRFSSRRSTVGGRGWKDRGVRGVPAYFPSRPRARTPPPSAPLDSCMRIKLRRRTRTRDGSKRWCIGTSEVPDRPKLLKCRTTRYPSKLWPSHLTRKIVPNSAYACVPSLKPSTPTLLTRSNSSVAVQRAPHCADFSGRTSQVGRSWW